MNTLRTLEATNGRETRQLEVFERDGNTYLWDRTNDPSCDSAELISDDSDASIMDLIRENGFEIGGSTMQPHEINNAITEALTGDAAAWWGGASRSAINEMVIYAQHYGLAAAIAEIEELAK